MQDENFLSFYNRLMDIIRRLKFTGTEISELEIVLKILKSLPDSYRSIVASFKILNLKMPLSINDLKVVILDLEQNFPKPSKNNAFVNYQLNFRRQNNNINRNSKNFNKNKSSKKHIICNYCNKRGHYEKNFFHKRNANKLRNNNFKKDKNENHTFMVKKTKFIRQGLGTKIW